MSKARWLYIMGISMVLMGCGSSNQGPLPPQVTVDQPIRRDVTRYSEFTGTTRAVESAEIRARVSGILERMDFVPSSIVDEGELLFIIEQGSYEATLNEAKGNVAAEEARLNRASSDLERIETAIKTNAVSQQDLDRATAERDQAAATLLQSEARLNRAKLDYSYTVVRSPLKGQVGRNLVDIGNLVGAGEPTLLTTVNKMDPIYVYFDAPENVVLEFLAAKRDTLSRKKEYVGRVHVALADGDGFKHEGKIDYIGNTVDPATGTIQIRAVIPNENVVLFPGLFVRIRVEGTLEPDALLIEERGVGTDIGGKYVLVIGEENVVELRYVTLGPVQSDGTVVVEDGLDPGDTYIVNGLLRARPGFPVTPNDKGDAESTAQPAASD